MIPLALYSAAMAKAVLEVFIIFRFVYAVLRLVQGTRGAGVLKGLTVLLVIVAVVIIVVTRRLNLERVDWLLSSMAPWILIPLFVLFQPEIRRGLIRLGQNPLFRMFFRPGPGFTEELVKATFGLARDKIGGLIAIEREVGLRGAWFAILEGLIVAGGKTREEVERIVHEIVPAEKESFVYLFHLRR